MTSTDKGHKQNSNTQFTLVSQAEYVGKVLGFDKREPSKLETAIWTLTAMWTTLLVCETVKRNRKG